MRVRWQVCTVAALALATAAFPAPFSTQYIQGATHDPAGGTVHSVLDTAYFGEWALSVEVTDGKSGQAVDLAAPDAGLKLTQQVEPAGAERLRWLLSFDNTAGAQQRWLMVRVVVTPATDATASFWNGEFDYDPCTADVLTGDLRYAIPLVALYGGRSGLAWGIEPDVLLSHFEGGASFEPRRRFWFGAKLVVDERATETLRLTVFGFEPIFGYLDAFERYHDLFPEVFAIDSRRCDPRCTGPGCDYTAWSKGSPELVRRFGGTWDWCMRGFIVGGNWARRRELERQTDRQWESYSRYLAQREENIKTCRVAGMRYFAPTWTDVDLAAERWPDARVMDPEVMTVWEKCLTTDCHMTFPVHNRYFEHMKQDLADIMASGVYAGMGLDCGGTDGKFRGEGAQASAGRAWDDEGVYVRVPIGTAQLMDYIHTLDAPVGKAGVVPNNGDYSVLARADAVLIEHSPTRFEDNWPKRLMAGEKILSWWDDFDLWTLTDYQNGERERLRHDVAAMARFIRLRSYQLGGVPMFRQASGIRSQVAALPRLARVVSTGWQPVPAMKADRPLMLARYGRGVREGEHTWPGGPGDTTWLVAGNPAAEEVASDIEVHSKYLGYSGVLLADDTGEPLRQTAAGSITTLHATIPAAWERVFYPCLKLSEGTDIMATVETSGDLQRLEIRLTVHGVKSPGEAMVAGRFGWGRGKGGPEPFRVEQPGVFEVGIWREWYHVDRDQLLSFPFVEGGKPACTIVIPEDAREGEEHAAFLLQEYFRFWTREVQGAEVVIPIVRGTAEGPRVVVGGDAEVLPVFTRGHISLDSDVLSVWTDPRKHPDPLGYNSPVPAMLKLLDVLDARYPYYGVCPTSFEHEREKAVYERAGLVGEFFDDIQYLPVPAE